MKDFTQGNIFKHLVSFSLPIVLGDFLFAIFNVIDAVWVGRLLGHQALAAVSATTPLIFFFISLIIGLRVATNVVVGQSVGAKNKALLSRVLVNSMITSLSLCLVISLVSVLSSRFLLKIINTPKQIEHDAHTYFVIILSGLVFKFMFNWFSGILRGLGDSKTPLILLIVTVVLNIILTPLLIIGPGFLPSLGIAGSAVGTILSTFIATLLGYIFLIKKNKLLNISNWKLNIDLAIIKKIFSVGLPVSAHFLIKSLSWVFLISLVNKFGPEVTAAYGIGIRLDMFAFLPSLSIGIAVSSMVAQNLGASRQDRIPEILKWSIMLSLSFSLLFFLLVNVYPQQISTIFTTNRQVLKYTEGYLRLVSFTYLTFSVIFAMEGIVKGAGNTMYQLMFTIISVLLVRIPLAYVLAEFTALRELGIWLAIFVSALVAAVLYYFYYLSGQWRRKVVFG